MTSIGKIPTIKVGINGFNRTARMIVKASRFHPKIELVAINHCEFSVNTMKDTFQTGPVDERIWGTVDTLGGSLIIDGKFVKVANNAADFNWRQLGVDYVVETNDMTSSSENHSPHLDSGAKRVVLAGPSKSGTIPVLLMGVNHGMHGNSVQIASASTPSHVGLAAVMAVLNRRLFEYNADIHADVSIPPALRIRRINSTSFVKSAHSVREDHWQVPLPESVLRSVPPPGIIKAEVVCNLEAPLRPLDVYDWFVAASRREFKGILDATMKPPTWDTFHDSPCSAVVDVSACDLLRQQSRIKLTVWHNLHFGHAHRVLEMIQFLDRGQ